MGCDLQIHDVVALLDDMPAQHFVSGKPLQLHREQIGTVVMAYDGGTFEVEFATSDGRTYTLLPIPAAKSMLLHDTPDEAAA